MTLLDKLTNEKIVTEKLPLADLLDNSFYYPSSHIDGGVVKYYSKHIQSFIYCDYSIGEESLLHELHNFSGYNIIGHRSVRKDELIPNGWNVQLPPKFDFKKYSANKNIIKTPFAHWAIYERDGNLDDNHGAKRFSLIYVGGEGVATYQAIYWSNLKSAKAIAIIQPGHGFGNNWTDFTDINGAFNWVTMNNRHGSPEIIFYGGIGGDDNNYENLNWSGFIKTDTIKPYYSRKGTNEPYGKVTIWKRKQ